jgi:hypothetical protein
VLIVRFADHPSKLANSSKAHFCRLQGEKIAEREKPKPAEILFIAIAPTPPQQILCSQAIRAFSKFSHSVVSTA